MIDLLDFRIGHSIIDALTIVMKTAEMFAISRSSVPKVMKVITYLYLKFNYK